MEESLLALYLKNERAAGKEKVLKNNRASKSSGKWLNLSPPLTASAVFTRHDDIVIHCLNLNYLLSSPSTALPSAGPLCAASVSTQDWGLQGRGRAFGGVSLGPRAPGLQNFIS